MAASTLANLAGGLKRIYSDETFEYAQNAAAPLVKKFEEAKDIKTEGAGYFWPFMLASPQNIGTPAEAGNVPSTKQRVEIQGFEMAGQFVGTFEISFLLEAAGTERGAWNKSEVKKHSWETLRDLVKHRNRIYAGTFGTAKLAAVQSNTVGTNTFVAQLSATGAGWGGSGQGALLLRRLMTIGFWTGNTLVADSRNITSIAKATRTVTFDGGTLSLTAGDNVYITGSHTTAGAVSTVPNGLMGLVDDGEFLDLIHGQSRSTNPELNSTVLRNGGTLRVLTEDLIIGAGFGLRQDVGGAVDMLVMNTGQWHKYWKDAKPQRFQIVNQGGSKGLAFRAGFDTEESFKFYLDGRAIDLCVSEDVAPRHVYGVDLSQMRRVVLKKLGWREWGAGNIFVQGADSNGLKTTVQATMYSLEDIATFAPWAHFRIQDLSDPMLCGSAYGGTDTL